MTTRALLIVAGGAWLVEHALLLLVFRTLFTQLRSFKLTPNRRSK